MKWFLSVYFLFYAISCTTIHSRLNHSSIFHTSYNTAWESTLHVLEQYPIDTEDFDSGQIKTKLINKYQIWNPPPGSTPYQDNRNYKIQIFLERTEQDQSVKIHIVKEEFINRDFIQKNIPIESTGLEEEVLLYRIGRAIYLKKKRKEFIDRKKEIKEDDILKKDSK